MTAEHPIPPGFLERASREAERYGDDPWILLRELVQNSRDAGARNIELLASTREGLDVLACVDDGSGMSRAEMRSYLLRLYASGKAPPPGEDTHQQRARGPVGRFGVGFWSVLRFSPAVVRVESRSRDQGTAFEVDCARRVLREVPCALSRRGTRVTLLRPAGEAPFVRDAERRLSHWAGYVRGLGQEPPPRLTFNGVPRNASFALPELIGERLTGAGFDGVVGLGKRPSVLLYAHGLLLREAASLEELLPKRRSRLQVDTPGLYPVVQVNADGLEVLMNRRAVVEDDLLENIVVTCERRLLYLRRRLLDRLGPMRLFDRLRVARLGLLPIAAALLFTVGAGGLTHRALTRGDVAAMAAPVKSPLSERAAAAGLDLGGGPRINQPSLTLDGSEVWDISVEGPLDSSHLVTLATLTRHDVAFGLLAELPVIARAPSLSRRSVGRVDVDMGLSGRAGVISLPVPSGHAVVLGSVRIDGVPTAVQGGAHGEPLVTLSGGERRARYATAREATGAPPSPALLEAPLHWPASAAARLALVAPLPAPQRVRGIEGFVKSRVRYTTSLADAAQFDAARGSFVERALSVGAGDCDVMNALFALMLRGSGIPARVAVGLVVDDGAIAPDLHAWTEYWLHGRWHTFDVSPPLPVLAHEEADRGPPKDALPVAGSAVSASDPVLEPPSPRDTASAGARPGPAPVERNARIPVDRATSSLLQPSKTASSAVSSATDPDWVAALRDRFAAPLVGAGVAASGVLLALFALTRLPLRRRRAGDDEALARLLWHWLQGPRGADPLHLRLRPFFPTLRGRRRSLADLERHAKKGQLFAAAPGDPLLLHLHASAVVVDSSPRGVAILLSLLPEILQLEELRPILRGEAPALLREVEAALREVDDGVRLHVVQGATGVRELELPVRRGGLPPRHLLVGEDDPHWARLRSADERPSLRRFRAARFILERTTLYRHERDGILARLAREATT